MVMAEMVMIAVNMSVCVWCVIGVEGAGRFLPLW